MPEYIRALIYLMILTLPVLFVAKKIAVPLVEEAEFNLWRNCWLAATWITFLSSSFFVFSLGMVALSIYIHRNSKNPILLYIILMFVAPCVPIGVGVPGLFNRIIDMDPPKLLALSLLMPVALQLARNPENRVVRPPDICIIIFYIFISMLALRHGDFNTILRILPSYFFDIMLPYFVFSRSLRNGLDVNRMLLAFVVASMPLAAIGVFEIWKSWRVYYVVILQWDFFLITSYLFRDGMLRAATTSVEAIAFGFMCMTGAGCLLAIRAEKALNAWRHVALAILVAGLLSSVSRGPWVGFAICVLVILLANLRTAMKLFFTALPGFVVLLLAHPPFIDRFVNLLPFVGSADKGSETYRSMLMESSLIVIGRYPLFGSDTFLKEPEMQRMIQGQGLIDIVNSYLQIALSYGVIGLFLFVMFTVILGVGLASLYLRSKTTVLNYPAVLGLLTGILVTIATTSSVSVIPYIYWSFFGLCSAMLTLGPSVGWRSSPATPARAVGGGEPVSMGVMPQARKMRVLGPG